MPADQALIAEIDSCSLPYGTIALWWLGQHSFVAKFGTTIMYLDPYLAANPRRNTPPLLDPGEIAHADLVLGTHDHADHIDRPSLPSLLAASPQATLVVPELLRERLATDLGIPCSRLAGMDAGHTLQFGNVRVSAVPAAHEALNRDPATGMHPYLGYVIQGHGVTLYHSGDSCIYEGMRATMARFDVDLALLPINGRDAERYARNCIGNMTYQEAADLAGDLKPRLTIPAHFDMFPGNTADPDAFQKYMAVKYPHLPVAIPQHGQRLLCSH